MNLDDLSYIKQIDTQDMLGEIDHLPDQLEAAWKLGFEQDLPQVSGIRSVVIAGMGGSAIGADLLAAYAEPRCRVPVIVHRDYGLPAWAQGPETLVIASSHSGNTEETLDAFEQAQARGCRLMTVSTGGKLTQMGTEAGAAVWTFQHSGQPRAAVGYSFGLLLAAFVRLGLLEDVSAELQNAVTAMRVQQERINVSVPAVNNPAKRQAGQLMDRIVVVIGAEHLAPVARRWKGQISELAKAWGQFEFLPEANHNTLAGTEYPEELLSRLMVMFLRGSACHPRNQLRLELTRREFMLQGLGTDPFDAAGDTALAQQWTALHFGDYMAFYLALAYGVDPTPIATLESFKAEMRRSS